MNILKKRIKDMSMRNKIFLGMLIAVWIPLVGFGIYTYRNTKNILLEQNYTRMEEQLLQAEKNIQILLESYKNISSIVMMDEMLPAMWSADFRQSGYEDMYFYIKDFFAGLQIANGEIKQMAVFSANPTIFQDYTYIYKITPQIQQENWYQKCISSKGRIKIVSGGLAEELNRNKKQEYVFYLVRPLELYNKGEEQTVLRLSMYEQRLNDTISENDESGQMYIVDEDNRIMSCKDKELIGLPVGNVIKKYQGTIGNNHRDKAEVDGREVLLSSVTADEGWKVVSVSYTEEIREKVAKSLINIILFIGIGIFSSVIVSGILASFFTKRLHGLTEAVTEMKNGEFGIQVTKGGKDEIGILERAFSEMSNRVKYLVDEVYQRELMKKTAEFNLLQEQVKPHFLYNVLSSITAMAMRSGNTETIDMVQHLSEFYRISLNKGKNIITVQDEVNLLNHYLAIQEVRFGERIQVSYELDQSLMECRMLKLILQPIVENAIHHGRKENMEILRIQIELKKEEDHMVFVISDNGIGMEKEQVEMVNSEIHSASEGFGLKNVAIRIQMQYGEKYGVKVKSELDVGTTIVIRLPMEYA